MPLKQRRDKLCGAVNVKISGKPIFWAKKELANNPFASFLFLRQTGLEALPLAKTTHLRCFFARSCGDSVTRGYVIISYIIA
jgi:hypothetical protein